MQLFEQLLLFIVSFIANLFSAFAGGGAGLLQLPALIFLGLPFAIALATHKLASVALGIGATIRHLKSSRLERNFTVFILLTGIPGVILGANVILLVPDRHAEIALGLLTLGLGIYSGLKRGLGQTMNESHRDMPGMIIGGSILFVIGVLNGSLTSGTGLFVTLWLVRWFGLDYQRAVAYTLVLVGMFWNGAGALTLGILGEIKWDWVPVLLVASLVGGYLGAHMAIKYGNRWIKRVFVIVTIAVGLKLVIG
ncbi:MAG: sulfite exporter TauE/SafE family protein [Gammaproteobacteria bacterium]|nr:MAG: sulfite exporter TauE/SafE family protein [Gammaproteobacteria bacterium]